jgi:hypothetical protein
MRRLVDGLEDVIAIHFLNGAALFAAQKHGTPASRRLVQSAAREVSVFALQAMDDACFEQGIEGAVNGDRGEPSPLLREPVQDLVSPDTCFGGGDFLKDLPAQLRKTDIPFGENLARALHGYFYAILGARILAWIGYHDHPSIIDAVRLFIPASWPIV